MSDQPLLRVGPAEGIEHADFFLLSRELLLLAPFLPDGLGDGRDLRPRRRRDPTIQLHAMLASSDVIATNDNWTDNTNAAEITGVAKQLGAMALAANDTTSSSVLVSRAHGNEFDAVIRASGGDFGDA